MANIKSQKKRALTNVKKNLQNTAQKSELKTAIKKVLKAVENGDITTWMEEADALSSEAIGLE